MCISVEQKRIEYIKLFLLPTLNLAWTTFIHMKFYKNQLFIHKYFFKCRAMLEHKVDVKKGLKKLLFREMALLLCLTNLRVKPRTKELCSDKRKCQNKSPKEQKKEMYKKYRF